MSSIGGVFETEIQKVFTHLKATHCLGWHRLSDTAAAGSVVAAQPSDYLVGLPPGSKSPLQGQRLMFVEVKASEVETKLGKAMLRPAQRGAIHYFRLLLDIPYLVIFWSASTGKIQLWDGLAIHGEGRMNKNHMLVEWDACGTVNKLRHVAVAQYLADYFQLPPAADTLAKVR